MNPPAHRNSVPVARDTPEELWSVYSNYEQMMLSSPRARGLAWPRTGASKAKQHHNPHTTKRPTNAAPS